MLIGFIYASGLGLASRNTGPCTPPATLTYYHWAYEFDVSRYYIFRFLDISIYYISTFFDKDYLL